MSADNEPIEGQASEVPPGDERPDLVELFDKLDGPEPAAEGATGEEAPQLDQQKELALIIFTAGQLLSMKYPSLSAVFTMDKCDTVSGSISPLLEYYNINVSLSGVLGLWLNLITTLVMFGMELKEAVRKDVEAALAAAAEEAKQGQGA